MPRIFDNIQHDLLTTLQGTLEDAYRADFCVGYFNLRGWGTMDQYVDKWTGGDGANCRILIGMQQLPHEMLREAISPTSDDTVDQARVLQLKKRAAADFREQLTYGVPTEQDERTLRRLSRQLRQKKVVVKLHLRHPLHAKLYLAFRHDLNNPITGFVGSSNLTLAGLLRQGELNVDVLEHDAAEKLEQWFNARWGDRWCLDISDELADIIDESWAREEIIPPYHIYLKIAYHLSQEARAGLTEFRVPREFSNQLFEFQEAAVRIAAHHVNSRSGVLIGDVVGLGKTLMATALAKVFQDDYSWETLIICPKNLVSMWQDYVERYHLYAKVLSFSQIITELPEMRRFRLVLVDESHTLRNREGKRYKALQEYIGKNDSRCILLTATPYNKTYLDLSAQLALFVPPDKDLGIRPEKLLSEIGETRFIQMHQAPVRSLAAFEKSEYADDWRELMRLYMVRRTRSFIQQNYAHPDPKTGRRFLVFPNGDRSYFPARVPQTVKFTIGQGDQYAHLYEPAVVDAVNNLYLPRYGLGNYQAPRPTKPPTPAEAEQLRNLSRSGRRLMGFCRSNLFKRLESGGPAFIQSLERHILRNFVYLHAIEQRLNLPIGSQDPELLDTDSTDLDADTLLPGLVDEEETEARDEAGIMRLSTETDYRRRAAEVYEAYTGQFRRRFKWVRPDLFISDLHDHLIADARALLGVLAGFDGWDPARDTKLNALERLLTRAHPNEKVLIFTQFADTVGYLTQQLKARSIGALEGVTGESADPTGLAWRFSPRSNNKAIPPEQQLRVLIATDVLSEGQNLQDCSIVVNYDLPWAIIRLIQRAGRVDRIGQQASEIRCLSFLPADGVERLIHLRAMVRRRLKENAEVVGTDESFFEDERGDQPILDIYNEKAGILEGDAETEVDLASYAYQIWKNAIDRESGLAKTIPALPPVVYSSRAYLPKPQAPEGVLVYLRTAEGNDALAWVDREGQTVTQSQLAILRAAECAPNTPGVPRNPQHHALVLEGVKHLAEETQNAGGQLGRPSGARFKTYERLKSFVDRNKGTLWESEELARAVEDIYRFPLQQSATDTLNRQLRANISDETLAELVMTLRSEGKLCHTPEDVEIREPQLICSLGLFEQGKAL